MNTVPVCFSKRDLQIRRICKEHGWRPQAWYELEVWEREELLAYDDYMDRATQGLIDALRYEEEGKQYARALDAMVLLMRDRL